MDDNDTSWPTKEPENWYGTAVTRKQAREILDDFNAPDSLINQWDEAQAAAEDGESFLLIRIVDR